MEHDNIILIRGNHDEMFLEYLFERKMEFTKYKFCYGGKKTLWYDNGGKITFNSYKKLPIEEQDKIYQFLQTLPYYKELTVNGKDYILVHAGINPNDCNKPLEEHDKHDLVWIRKEFIKNPIPINKTIIVGHTRVCTILDYDKILHIDNKIFMDCGICCRDIYGQGYLGCLRLDDMEEFYVY